MHAGKVECPPRVTGFFMGLVCTTSGGMDCWPVRFLLHAQGAAVDRAARTQGRGSGGSPERGCCTAREGLARCGLTPHVLFAAWIYGHSLPLHGHMLAGVLCTWEGCGAVLSTPASVVVVSQRTAFDWACLV